MTSDLKIWENKALKAGTQVVLLSSGTVEANAKQGFHSRILLDQYFSAGKAFGADGTPSALLLDERSRIASKIAVGKQDIIDSVFTAQISVPRHAFGKRITSSLTQNSISTIRSSTRNRC